MAWPLQVFSQVNHNLHCGVFSCVFFQLSINHFDCLIVKISENSSETLINFKHVSVVTGHKVQLSPMAT